MGIIYIPILLQHKIAIALHYDSSVKTVWPQTHWSHVFDYLTMTVVFILLSA